MPRLVVSTCGTSLLNNGAGETMRRLLSGLANRRTSGLSAEERGIVDDLIEARRQRLLAAGPEEAKRLSAELNGLLTFYEARAGSMMSGSQGDMHYLLHTDTHQGRVTAEVLLEWLEQHGFHGQLLSFPGLDTASLDSFREAMSEVIHWCAQVVGEYRGWPVVFNLTGGFKALNSFLQAVGMFYADECVYKFESSEALLTIPRLPVRLDAEGVVEANLALFRRLALGEVVTVDEARGIPQTLLCEVDGQVALSSWGELVWQRCRDDLYAQRLMEPIGPRLELSPQFSRQVEDLPPDRRCLVNARLDQLWLHLGERSARAPRSLDFKSLKGNPSPPSTHECDAWADGSARRILGHFVDGLVFHVDQLSRHL